jgi:hypothetical protein
MVVAAVLWVSDLPRASAAEAVVRVLRKSYPDRLPPAGNELTDTKNTTNYVTVPPVLLGARKIGAGLGIHPVDIMKCGTWTYL